MTSSQFERDGGPIPPPAPASPIIPAATLVLFRDPPCGTAGLPGQPPEHLFVERAARMAFAPGATVFPGGRVDPGDHDLAARYPALDPDDAAARIAAVRETIEETGVAVGLPPGVDIAALRGGLAAGNAFADLLRAAGVTLDLDALTPFARWCPNFREMRNFDTRFYLAAAPGGAEASVDETENVRLFWATANDVLDQARDGKATVIFPTRCNLERLATLAGLAAAVEHARRLPVSTITPWIEEQGGVRLLCIPDGLGYSTTKHEWTSTGRG